MLNFSWINKKFTAFSSRKRNRRDKSSHGSALCIGLRPFSLVPLYHEAQNFCVYSREKKNTWSCTVLVNSSYDLELSLNSLIVFINLFIYLFQWASCWSWPIVCQWTLRMVSYCVGLLVMVNSSHDPLLSSNFLIVASWLLLFIFYSNEVHAGADRWFMSI